MVITVLSAQVLKKNWQILKKIFADETKKIPEEIIQTFLIQSKNSPNDWQIVTHWRSQKDLESMRKNTKVPTGVRIFRAANAEPSLSIWNIREYSSQL